MLEMPSLASYSYISSLIRAHYTGSAIVTVPPRLHMKFASRYPLTPRLVNQVRYGNHTSRPLGLNVVLSGLHDPVVQPFRSKEAIVVMVMEIMRELRL